MEEPIQEDLYGTMNALAKDLAEIFKPYGFILLTFPFGNGMNGERMNYISNAKREDTLAAMKEFIAKNEGRCFESPTIKQ